MASKDWVWGNWKLSEKSVPADFTVRMVTTRSPSHSRTTRRR